MKKNKIKQLQEKKDVGSQQKRKKVDSILMKKKTRMIQ